MRLRRKSTRKSRGVSSPQQTYGRLMLETLEARALLAFAPQSTLLAPTPVANAEFGAAVDVDGDVVVVGAPGEGTQGTGAVYVFSREDKGTPSQTDDTWQFMARLSAGAGAPGDRFGAAVAVNMQTATIVVGSPGSDVVSGGRIVADAGSVSVFQFVPTANGGSFVETVLTLGSDAAAGDGFGASLSLSGGDALLVGAPRRDAAALADAGAAYIFSQSANAWSLTATLAATSSAEAGAGFGSSVALGQGQAIVGAPSEDAGGVDRGAIYRFAQSQGVWAAGTRHTGPTVVDSESSANPKPVLWVPSDGDRFGYAVAEDQGIVIVGAPGSVATGIGSAHVFADLGGGFAHAYSPKVPPIPPASHFGAAVATAVHSFTQAGPDITFVIGAPDIAFAADFAPGAAQILRTTEQEQGVMPDDGGNGDRLGAAIAINGFTIAFGAPGYSAGGVTGQGRVIVYGTAAPPPPPTPMDFGDLGWPYTAALRDDGPRHVIGSLFLGVSVDAESDGQYSYQTSDASGTGDDTSGSDDEDGIVFPAIPVVGRSVTVEVTASADGKVDAWMDFSGENDGSDPNAGKFTADERILASVPVTAGKNTLTFTIPSTARPSWDGTMAARFRLSSAGNLGPNGLATDGEVEDYRVAVHQLPTGAVKISSGTSSTLLPRARLSLDLSDSRTRNADEKFLRYEWDLDNDGQYDDSTTVPQQGRPYIDSQVSFAYSQFADLGLGLGVHTVGVRLVTDLGYSATASTTFTMDTGPFDIFLRNTGGEYLIKRDGDYVVFSDPNVVGSERRWLRATLTALYFSGGNGNDTLTIDLSNGDPIPPQGLRFDGNGSGDFDTLVIKGGSVDTMRHDFTGPDSGWINTGGGAIRYTTIEPVETTGTTNNLVLTMPVNARPFGPVYWVPGGNTAEPDGYAYSVSPVNGGVNAGGQVGRGSGQTLTHDIIDPSQLDATTYWGLTNSMLSTTAWGFDTGIGLSGVGQMSSKDGNGKFRSKFDSSRLNASESNFSGGYAQWNLDAIPFDNSGDSGPGTPGNTPTSYLPARLRLWVTTMADSPLALQAPPAELLNSIGAVLKVTQDFKARLLMEVYNGSSWQSALSYYDANSTADSGAITTYNTGFWVEKGVMYLEDASGAGTTRLRSRENAVEVHTFTNPTDSITITARGGQDVQLVSVDPAFAPGLIVLQGTATDRFLMANSNVLPDSALVFLASGSFTLDGKSEAVAAFAADLGTTVDVSGGTLSVGGVNADFEIAGVLAGSGGSVAKSGTGAMTLSGANTFLGVVSVASGSLVVTGSLADGTSANDVTIAAGATLAGTGTINGGVLSSGSVSPGVGAGAIGRLTANNNLTFQAGAKLVADLAGSQAGSGYDQVRIAGANRLVALNGATIDVTLGGGYVPTKGTAFRLIDVEESSSAVSGTFTDSSGGGLSEGSTLTVGGVKYVISYTGGTGNDVVLTVIEDPVFSTPTGSTFTDPDSHSGPVKIIKRGSGTLILNRTNAHSGGVVVEEGELIVQDPAALGTGLLDIRAGAKVTFAIHDAIVTLGGLAFATGASIDFGFARIVLPSGGPAPSLPVILGLMQSGYAGGWITGPGLMSRTAGSIAGGGLGCFVDIDGSMTMGFAATGDTNLDGTVDILDVSAMVASSKFNTGGSATWSEGDFNYDFVIDILDISDVLGTALFNAGPYVPASSPQAGPSGLSVTESGQRRVAADALPSDVELLSTISPLAWAAIGSDDMSGKPTRKFFARKTI